MDQELSRYLQHRRTNGAIPSFHEFIQRTSPRFRWYRHATVLADALQRVADGRCKRLMVFMPPRHGKSQLTSRLFSAYYLYRYPERWVAVSSYGAGLAYTLSRAARQILISAGGVIDPTASAAPHWETGSGGGLWAAGVGGPATGKGWHLGIVDDPIKNAEEAASRTIREKQKEWYEAVWSTREMGWSDDDPDGAEIIVQTRWHQDDLAGWRLSIESEECEYKEGEPERWHILNMPAISEETPPSFPPSCTVTPDWRQPGEALCPEIRPLSRLRQTRNRIGVYFFEALYQQRPAAREGSLFHVGKMETIDGPPPGLRIVRAWDKASTEGGGDWTAGVKMGTLGDGIFYVLDVVRGQWSTDRRNERIRRTAETDGHGVRILGQQDPGSAGVDESKAFVRLLAGYPVRVARVTGAKESRADPLSAQINAGNIKLVRGAWNDAFVEELRSFPNGAHDDQVDAAADAFNDLAAGRIETFLAGGRRDS
jgi:predicted phage terminase large subunit-like protein